MPTTLVIVESPTKAKTIKRFLGKGYAVESSFGHIRDLPKSKMGVDTENDFAPKYVIPAKAKKRVSELKVAAKKADEVILASDEDREGEAIAWHLAHTLGLRSSEYTREDSKRQKSSPQIKRIVFHEITKRAIEEALAHPREIDENLVDAQQARRIVDRLVGYELSPFLWKKIRMGLSAGRVQSAALRFIVEREKERIAFKEEKYWAMDAHLSHTGGEVLAHLIEINGKKFERMKKLKLFAGDYSVKTTSLTSETASADLARDLEAAAWSVKSVEKKRTKRSPYAPFTTSTLQQTAINRLHFSSKQTMMLAQRLYEEGLITYMRTDSTNLAPEAVHGAREFIGKNFGAKYLPESPRIYAKKSKGAQEAHEAIRPTDPSRIPDTMNTALDANHKKLYRLIWQRFVACQMASAEIDTVRILIDAKSKQNNYLFSASGSTIVFDGFYAVAPKPTETAENLPIVSEGDSLSLTKILPQEKTTSAPPRYGEASLVKVMEERGIGRPSTYAPTISTIFARKYIERDENKKLYPMEIGTVVSDVLVEHFHDIADPDFTAEMENELDSIAEGEKKWVPVVRTFYTPFHKNIEEKTKKVKKEDFTEKIGRKCPDCGKDLIKKFGRFGQFIACEGYPECKYTEQTGEEKKLAEEFKDIPCDKCGAPMTVKRGRFGAFLGCSRYPECRGIQKIENKTGVKCPKCEGGEITEKKSKRGRVFYGCNRYPQCDFALWKKPTGEKCPKCGSLLVFAAKGSAECSNKECT